MISGDPDAVAREMREQADLPVQAGWRPPGLARHEPLLAVHQLHHRVAVSPAERADDGQPAPRGQYLEHHTIFAAPLARRPVPGGPRLRVMDLKDATLMILTESGAHPGLARIAQSAYDELAAGRCTIPS
jgi:hypothetical protein